jgi:hypothetical protein
MKTIAAIVVLFLLLLLCTKFAYAQPAHRVNGYYRNNGIYVMGHYQTNPNGDIFHNWSTRGNYNPY